MRRNYFKVVGVEINAKTNKKGKQALKIFQSCKNARKLLECMSKYYRVMHPDSVISIDNCSLKVRFSVLQNCYIHKYIIVNERFEDFSVNFKDIDCELL